MKRFTGIAGTWAAMVLAVVLAVPAALAQTDDVRILRVRFSAGQSGATLDDRITGYQTVEYLVGAKAGQVLTLGLDATNEATSFNLFAPGRGPGDTALVRGDVANPPNQARVVLPADGDYRIQVYLFRAAARRGERSDYALDIRVRNGAVTQLPEPPGTGSGVAAPAYWRVTGLGTGDSLNVRSGPSTANAVVDRLPLGTVVRNFGCQNNSSGTRWCSVGRVGQTKAGGWASSAYLAASQKPDGGVAGQLPGDAPVPGTGYSATGRIDCSLLSGVLKLRCSYGVTRRGNGFASLVIQLPNLRQRRIEFEAGRPVSSNSGGDIYGEWKGDAVVVSIGTDEIYTVPNAVLYGG